MISYLELLNKAPWLNAIFLLLAVGSIAVSVVLYRRNLHERRPVYKIRSFPLIRSRVKDLKSLEIRHDGKPISELTMSRVAFWNTGREPIRAMDFAQKDRLRVVVSDGAALLDANVAYASAVNNVEISIEQANGEVLIGFEYLARNEGLALNVYHTGSAVSIHGTFVGSTPIAEASDSTEYYTNKLLGPLAKLRPVWFAATLTVIFLPVLVALTGAASVLDGLSSPFRRIPKKFGIQ